MYTQYIYQYIHSSKCACVYIFVESSEKVTYQQVWHLAQVVQVLISYLQMNVVRHQSAFSLSNGFTTDCSQPARGAVAKPRQYNRCPRDLTQNNRLTPLWCQVKAEDRDRHSEREGGGEEEVGGEGQNAPRWDMCALALLDFLWPVHNALSNLLNLGGQLSHVSGPSSGGWKGGEPVRRGGGAVGNKGFLTIYRFAAGDSRREEGRGTPGTGIIPCCFVTTLIFVKDQSRHDSILTTHGQL